MRFPKNILLVISFIVALHCAAFGQTFRFDAGTEGWTLDGPYDPDTGLGPYPSNFSILQWSAGSIMFEADGGHGIYNPGATWWLMQFLSPNLSGNSAWQSATGYSVRLNDSMSLPGSTLWANLYVAVYDYDQARTRYFYNGTAQPITSGSWTTMSFDWSGIATFPVNYSVTGVFIYIWGTMAGSYNGPVYLDDVVATVTNPVPVLTSLSPSSRTAGGSGFL